MYPILPVYKFIPYIHIINSPIENKNEPITALDTLKYIVPPIPIINPAYIPLIK